MPNRPIADLFSGEEVAIAGTVHRATTQRPWRRLAREGEGQRRKRRDHRGVVQPAVAGGEAPARHQVRLRGELKRGEFTVKTYDLNGVSETADFAPVYPASEEVSARSSARSSGTSCRTRDWADPIPADVKAAGASAAPGCTLGAPPPARPGRGRARPPPAGLRRAARAAGRAPPPRPRAGGAQGAAARRSRRR